MSEKEKKRKTGLGTDAFFQQPQSAEEEKPAAEAAAKEPEKARAKPEKLVATQQTGVRRQGAHYLVTLYQETLRGMEMLKVQAQEQGIEATYSDILDEAIRELMAKKGVTL